ncbi:hypothetical protein [Allosalinactinospora lopnorensis]|uniref:hypothetical protein n=1 Tax=Allosalinactinospora lopnorensis TaxID=1352348 RepID=UPI000696F17E|nr:hypothetical protein [Allosalinactinospora lopnorensis]
MDEQAMLTRDLVLRLCANATEFDQGWIRAEGRIVVPFTAARDTALIESVIAAGRAMGVNRLLVCRTRAEFAYEPVTEVPGDAESIIALIRSWGEDPTDFLVAVEDFSAAVLVTASTLTVAAGPDDFVRPLVAPTSPRPASTSARRPGPGATPTCCARRSGTAAWNWAGGTRAAPGGRGRISSSGSPPGRAPSGRTRRAPSAGCGPCAGRGDGPWWRCSSCRRCSCRSCPRR